MLTLFIFFMLSCSSPGDSGVSPHWHFKIEVGQWNSVKQSDDSYMTIADGRQLQKELEDVHKNTLLLRGQNQENSTWDQVTRCVGLALTGMVMLGGVLYKINGLRGMIPAGVH